MLYLSAYLKAHRQEYYTTANNIVGTAEKLGILKQINKGRRNRKFAYQDYIDILSEGTEIVS